MAEGCGGGEMKFEETNTFDFDAPPPDGQMFDGHGTPIPSDARDEILFLRTLRDKAAELLRLAAFYDPLNSKKYIAERDQWLKDAEIDD